MRAGGGEGNCPFWWGLTRKALDMEDETPRGAQGAADSSCACGGIAGGSGGVSPRGGSVAAPWGAVAPTSARPLPCRTLHPPAARPWAVPLCPGDAAGGFKGSWLLERFRDPAHHHQQFWG